MEKLGRWKVSAGGRARPVEELDGGGPWLSPRHLLLDRRVVGPPNHRGSGLQLRRATGSSRSTRREARERGEARRRQWERGEGTSMGEREEERFGAEGEGERPMVAGVSERVE